MSNSEWTERNYSRRENLRWIGLTHSEAPTELLVLFDKLIEDKIKEAGPTLQKNESYQKSWDILEDGWELLKEVLPDSAKDLLLSIDSAQAVNINISNKQYYRNGFLDALRLTGNKHLLYLLEGCHFEQAACDDGFKLIPLPDVVQSNRQAG